MSFSAVVKSWYRHRSMSHLRSGGSGWQGGQLHHRNQVHGQSSDVGPGLVCVEVEELQLPDPGVFQGFDPVLAPSPGSMSGIKGKSVPAP
jgi:hypothetical protein